MAQIKTYQQRQGLPTQTGVQLQVSQAQSNVGTSLFELGTQFGQIGDRLDLAQDNRDISTSTLNATVKLQDLETELSTADPRIARGSYQGRADQIFQEASGGLSGRALDKFTQNFNQLSIKSRFAVKSASVTRHRQQLEGGLETTLAGLVRAAGNSQMLPFRLRGAQIAKGDLIKTGLADIDAMVDQGVIKADWAARRKLKFLKNVAGAGVSSKLRKSSLKDLIELGTEMSTDSITDPEVADYWKQLNEKERLAFQKKVMSTTEIQLNIIDKQEVKRVAGLQRKYDRNYGVHMNKILLAHENPDNNEMPTRIEITEALANDEIGATEYNKLKAALVNSDPAGSDDNYIKDILARIRNAPDKAAITKLIKEMEGQTGAKGKLRFEDFKYLALSAETQIPKTPAAKRANLYGVALEKVLTSSSFLDQILPGAKERAAYVRMGFYAQIAEGADPVDAFTDALDAFKTRGTVYLNSIPRPQFGPSKKLNDWNLDDVEKAREETKTKFKGKAHTLAIQLLTLNSLAAYLAAKAKSIGDAKSDDPEAGTLKSRLEEKRSGDN